MRTLAATAPMVLAAVGPGSLAETGISGVGLLAGLAALAIGAGAGLLFAHRTRHRD